MCPGAPTEFWSTATAVRRTCAPVLAVAMALASIAAAISASCTTSRRAPGQARAHLRRERPVVGLATRSIIWQNRCAPTVESTPWRLVTSGASLWDHAACSCGLSTYPLEAEADVPSTPRPPAPAVADCRWRAALGDWAAAAAAGEGLVGFPAPAAA